MHSDCDQVWSKIRHPNVLRESYQCMVIYISLTNRLEFLGANILDEKPFIVMPYMRNGNSRDYLQQHPNSDRLQIVCIFNIHAFALAQCDNLQLHGISLGLVHLHSLQIVHGDLKAVRFREK
jgi:serine/threonine protein kinase